MGTSVYISQKLILGYFELTVVV